MENSNKDLMNDSFLLKVITLVLVVVGAIGVFYAYKYYSIRNQPPIIKEVVKTKKVVEKVYIDKSGSVVSIGMKDLRADLIKNYKFLSSKSRERIITTIKSTSEKYKINPIVIYGLIAVESSFRPWIKSDTRTVTASNGKKVKDRAIGLGSIMYSIWGEKLVKNNILETKSDLYVIENNIEGIGYILAELKLMPLKKGTYDKTTSALRRYFGGNYRSYSEKIKDKIGSIIFSKVL